MRERVVVGERVERERVRKRGGERGRERKREGREGWSERERA